MLLTLQLKLKIKKRPHSFNHNCNHYSLSEGERQKKKIARRQYSAMLAKFGQEQTVDMEYNLTMQQALPVKLNFLHF
jgi:hypothetical protein